MPAIPSIVFVPAEADLSAIPALPYSVMTIDDRRVVVLDHELAHLRKIDQQPRDPIKDLPKIGAVVTIAMPAFAGLRGKVVYANRSHATVAIPGFSMPLKIAPSLVTEIPA